LDARGWDEIQAGPAADPLGLTGRTISRFEVRERSLPEA
jgi:hypothetical protein